MAVPSLFTATSRTYKSERGIYTTTLYGQTVNTKEANGTWKPIEGAEGIGAASPAAKPGGGVTPNASVSSTASHDCALASNSPTTSICNATTDKVGYDGTNTDNSLVEFELKEALPSGANVLNAQLGMYLGSASTTNPVSVTAYAATKPWTLSATWSTYDGTNAWASPGGDFSTTNAVVNPSVTTPAGWAHWYPTQIVQEWVNGTLENDGLLLADSTQKTTNDMLSFNSLDASSNKPFLTVSWTPRGQEDPPVYTMQPFPTDAGATMKVNLASGDLFVNSNDLSAAGTGPPLLAEHNYDSLNTEGGTINPWYSLPGASVYADGSVAIGINRYDYAPFIRQSDGSFLTPRSIDATLCAVNGTTCTGNSVDGSSAAYALTFNHDGNGPLYKAGNKLTFGSTGGVLSDADTSGKAIVYHSGPKGIESLTNADGRTFKRTFFKLTTGFEVTASWTDTTSGAKVKYAYNTANQLQTYTDAEAHKTKYAYDEEGELKEVTDPSKHVTTLNYDSSHRIKVIKGPEVNGLHPTWEYTYYEVGKAPAPCTSAQKATVLTEANGNEEPPLTYCANVFDEVERVAGYPAIGQAGGYLVESEPLDEAATTNVSVDLASGNLSIGGPDLTIESEGEAEIAPMVLERIYNSQAAKSGKSIGPRWRWSTGPSLYLSNYGGMVVVHGRDGYAVALPRKPDGTYESPGEYEGTLTKNADGTFTLTNADAPTYNFNAAGVLTSQTPEGSEAETVTDTEVSGATVLHKLTAPSGKYFEVGYNGTSGRVESLKGSAGESHYGYNGTGQLASFTSASGTKTEYGYSEAGYINKVTTPEVAVSIVTTGGKVSEITSTPVEGPQTTTKYTYGAPLAPTCNPATDVGAAVVTTTIENEEPTSESVCYNTAGESTGPGDPEAEAEEEEGTEPPPEEPGETCTEDPELGKEDCALEEPAPEEVEDLPKRFYGLADNNWLQTRVVEEKVKEGKTEQRTKEGFDYLSQAPITALHAKEYRRTVAWNTVSEAERNEETPNVNLGAAAHLADIEEWIKRVKAAGAEPYIAFDLECFAPEPAIWDDPRPLPDPEDNHVCKEAPSKAQYKVAVERFLKPTAKHAILGEVRYFEALNEPNLASAREGEHVKPTWSATEVASEHKQYVNVPRHNGAYLAGEYWRALDNLCATKVRQAEKRSECYVAAGDFDDIQMRNAWNKHKQGYNYFHQYVEGMGKGPKAYRWSWHSYQEGADTFRKVKYRNHPKEWWKPFHLFEKAVDRVTEHAKYKYPNIWLSEQGAEFFVGGTPTFVWKKRPTAAPYIMRAFVEHGSQQLTRQPNPVTRKGSQVARFFYYSTRGAPEFDSGLLNAVLPEAVSVPRGYHVNQPRGIYRMYAKKTPSH